MYNIKNYLKPSFSYRIRKVFSKESSINIGQLNSNEGAFLEITELTDKYSSDLVKVNLVNNRLCYKGTPLNINDFEKMIIDQYKNYNIDGKLIYLGFDIDKKYFITIFDTYGRYKVLFWIPVNDKDFKIVSNQVMKCSQHLEGKFIELIKIVEELNGSTKYTK